MVSEEEPSDSNRCSGLTTAPTRLLETEALSKSLHSRMKRVSDTRPSRIGRVSTAPTSPLVPSSSKRFSRRTPGPSWRL